MVSAAVAQGDRRVSKSWEMVKTERSSALRHWENRGKKQFTVTMELLLLKQKC